MQKKLASGLSAMMFVATAFCGILFFAPPANAEINAPHDDGLGLDPTGSDDEYNTDGDWTVEDGDYITFEDGDTIIVHSNLTIEDGGTLILNGTVLSIDSTDCNASITVEDGGVLVINQSYVSPLSESEFFNFYVDGTLLMDGTSEGEGVYSEIYMSTGVHLNPGSTARLYNTLIDGSFGNGLIIQTNDILTNCLETYDNYGNGVYIENCAPYLYNILSNGNHMSGFYITNSPGGGMLPWGPYFTYLSRCTSVDNDETSISEYNSVVIVDGFGNSTVLLVDDDNAEYGSSRDVVTLMIASLINSSVSFDVHIVGGGDDGPMYEGGLHQLKDYDLVIWMTGYENSNTLKSNDQAQLTTYLNSNGMLWLIGQDVLSSLGKTNSFINNTMKVDKTMPNGGYNCGVPLDKCLRGEGVFNGTDIMVNKPLIPPSLSDRSDGPVPASSATSVFYGLWGSQNYHREFTVLFNATTNGTPEEQTYKSALFGFEITQISSVIDIYAVTHEMLKWFGVQSGGIDGEGSSFTGSPVNLFFSNSSGGVYNINTSNPSVDETDVELTDNSTPTFINVTFDTIEIGDMDSVLTTYNNYTDIHVEYANTTPANGALYFLHNRTGYTVGWGYSDVNGLIDLTPLPNATYRRGPDSNGDFPWGEYPTLSPWTEERRGHIIIDREEYTIEVSKGDYKNSAYLIDTFQGGVIDDYPPAPQTMTLYNHARDVYAPSVEIENSDFMDTQTDVNISINVTNKGDMDVIAEESIEVEMIVASQEYYGAYFNKTTWQWDYSYYGYWEPVAFYTIDTGLDAGDSDIYNFTWNVSYSLPSGYYYMTTFVRIVDAGEYNYSNNIHRDLVYINQTDVTPTVSIISPVQMQGFEHGIVEVLVVAFSEYGNISDMWIRYNDGIWNSVVITPGPIVLYTDYVDSTQFTNGVNTIYARVWDGVDDMKYCFANFVVKDNISDPRDSSDWTIGIYMNADNSLGAAGFDGKDIREVYDWASTLYDIEESGSSAHANVLILKDGPLYNSPPGDDCQLMYIDSIGNEITNSPGNMVVNNVSEVDMSDPNTLINFTTWMKTWYPADNYALILWDHGYGWQMAGQDVSSGRTMMTMDKLKIALAAITNNGEDRLDILGFDECMMGMAEVAYQVHPYVDYMVASERTEPGDGWWYHGILDDLTSIDMTPAELAIDMVDSYVYSYDNNIQKPGYDPVSDRYVRNYGLAAINAYSKMDLLLMNIDNLCQAVNAKVATYGDEIATALGETETYNYAGNSPYYDIYDFAKNLRAEIADTNIQTNATAVMNAMNYTILYSDYGVDDTSSKGLSIYLPLTSEDYLVAYSDLDFAENSVYVNLLNKWYAGASNDSHALPFVNITLPASDASVSGIYNASGCATGTGGVARVQVKIDGDTWATATGTTSWVWAFNSSHYSSGIHQIIARSYDAAGYVCYYNTSFTITAQKGLVISLMYPSSNVSSVYVGNTGQYWLNIENNANTALDVAIDVDGTNDDWYTAISDPSPTIGAFQSVNVLLSYEVPGDAALEWSNVTVEATATGASASMDISMQALEVSWTFNLAAGWNLISLPLYNDSLDYADYLAEAIGDSCLEIVYKAYNGTYYSFIPGETPDEDAFELDMTIGMYVYMDEAITWVLYGDLPGTGHEIYVSKGYNLIGFPMLTSVGAKDMLDKMGGNGREADKREGSSYSGYIQAASSDRYNFEMSPGNGYYVWSDGDYILTLSEILPWFPEMSFEYW
jgi:hypothetical protein